MNSYANTAGMMHGAICALTIVDWAAVQRRETVRQAPAPRWHSIPAASVTSSEAEAALEDLERWDGLS